MNRCFFWQKIVFLFLFCCLRASATELRELMPWIDANSATIGMSYQEFKAIRPSAIYFSPHTASEPTVVNGNCIEEADNGAKFIYVFVNNALAAVYWEIRDTSDGQKTQQIRRALGAAHGSPMEDLTAQMDSAGVFAKVTREVYRPIAAKTCFVALTSTSRALEVHAADESIYAHFGKKSPLIGYDEIVHAGSNTAPSLVKASTIVDLLAVLKRASNNSKNNTNSTSPLPSASQSAKGPQVQSQDHADHSAVIS